MQELLSSLVGESVIFQHALHVCDTTRAHSSNPFDDFTVFLLRPWLHLQGTVLIQSV